MPLFGRQRAYAREDAIVTPRRRGWALFSPYPRTYYTSNLTDSPLPTEDTHHPQALIPTTPRHEGHPNGVLMTQRWFRAGAGGPAAL